MAACLAAALLAGGCGPQPPDAVHRSAVATDACADRMHEILGHVLLYYAAHRKLPPTAEALVAAGGGRVPPLACPISGKAYVYDPKGLPIAGRKGAVVLYDPEPSHWGMRWGILIEPPAGSPGLSARVILLNERNFLTGK